mgnify:FL=1|tara:strand:- start:293 stop:508 length:216 start_codon:yes stop_codon:yes gene_type:complete
MNEEQLKRLENSWRTTEDIYHEIAKNYVISMNIKYGGLGIVSLDDFLCEYCEDIKYEDLKLGESILRLFEL